MSGRKRILVDESEWYRLKKQSKQLGAVNRELPKLVADVRRQTEADLNRVFDTLEGRQRIVEQTVSNLSVQARAIEADTNRRLEEHSRRAAEMVRASAGELRRETRQMLAEQDASLRAEIGKVRGDLAGLVEDRSRAAEASGQWLRDARVIRDLISESLPHERYAPGRLDAIDRRLRTAAEDVGSGRHDAALSLLQVLYHDLNDLRVEVELRDREWLFARAVTVEALVFVEGAIEDNRVRPVEDEHGEPLHGVTLDVDHWTRGALGALRTEVDDLLRRVRDDVDPVALGELRAIAEERAPEFERRLGELIERAGMRQFASQIRVNLADMIAQTLDEEAGYHVIEGTYAGTDQREAFFAKLVHPNGNEIVVDVASPSEDGGAALVRLHSFDRDVQAEADRTARAEAINESLRARGIPTQPTQTEAEEPAPEVRDFERIKRELPGRATES
jgi:hypothetical protein